MSMTNKKESLFSGKKQGRRPRGFEPQTYENITTGGGEPLKKVEEYGIIINPERMSKRWSVVITRRSLVEDFNIIKVKTNYKVEKIINKIGVKKWI